MGELIDRQAAIDYIRMQRWRRFDGMTIEQAVITMIEEVPTIEEQWIPCSERLPKNRLCVLVTYKYEYGLIDHGITWYGQAEGKWNTSREVIAWMPLPEPYKGEQE